MARLALAEEGRAPLPGAIPGSPAVLVADDRRRIVEANDVAGRLLGLARDEIVGRKLDTLIAPARRDRLDHVWRAFLDGGGHAGPFELATPGAVEEIQIALTENLMPNRHLVVLAPLEANVRLAAERVDELSHADDAAVFAARAAAMRPPSARELEVVRLLATGATDPQIAKLLDLSPATIQTHVRNAKSKLGARTRAHAVALAISRGLIAAD